MIIPRTLDDADLAKIWVENPSPIVLKLIETIHALRDEVDHLKETVAILGDELDELRTLSS